MSVNINGQMIYNRKILSELEKQIKRREIVVLTGMRRVGKTTLLREIFQSIESKNKIFLDLENPLNQKIFEEANYDNIWANLKPFGITNKEKSFIFLDEIQVFPDIVKVIKYLYDHYNVKFFLTGSSSFYLKNLFPESLSGRKVVFELFPLDFEEFLWFNDVKKDFTLSFEEKSKNKNTIEYEKLKKLYEEYLLFGGFPQVVTEKDYNNKKQQLSDIFQSYFEKDVKNISDFREINKLRDLILLLLARVGSKLDITKLSSELGISRETIYSYLSFLEMTYFIYLISPFSRSLDQDVSGTKKVYVCDNGFASLFGSLNIGGLLENAIFLNLKKFGEVKYYERRGGREIDFILKKKDIAIEVKNKADSTDYERLKHMAKRLKIDKFYVVSKEFVENKGVIISSDV